MKEIAKKVADEIIENEKPKKIKVRTLMKKFGYLKRTEDSSRVITELLSDNDIYLNPSIMKIGEVWKLSLDDRVTLSTSSTSHLDPRPKYPIYDYKNDPWFSNLATKVYRNEREVETKFIIPLLGKLSYSEDDRYDQMPVKASNGSRPTVLMTDFTLTDSGNEELDNQALLIVEAKYEKRVRKERELEKAAMQTKSYAVWLSCHYGLVTDGRKIQVIDLFPRITVTKILFECLTSQLQERFEDLYQLIGKPALVDHYLDIIN